MRAFGTVLRRRVGRRPAAACRAVAPARARLGQATTVRWAAASWQCHTVSAARAFTTTVSAQHGETGGGHSHADGSECDAGCDEPHVFVSAETQRLRDTTRNVQALVNSGAPQVVEEGTGYSQHACALWEQLTTLVTHPGLYVAAKEDKLFVQLTSDRKGDVLCAFTSEEAAHAFVNSKHVSSLDRVGMRVAKISGVELSHVVDSMETDAKPAGVTLLIDLDDEAHAVHVAPAHTKSLLGEVRDAAVMHGIIRDVSNVPQHLREAMFNSSEFAVGLNRVLDYKFMLFSVADAYLGDLGHRFMSTPLPFTTEDSPDEPLLATFVFTHLTMASQFLHYHGPSLMHGKDPELFKIESTTMSGSRLLKQFIAERVQHDKLPTMGNCLVVNPPAFHAGADSTYLDVLRNAGIDSAQAAAERLFLNLVHLPPTTHDSSKHWIAEAIRRGLLSSRADDD